MEMFGVFVRCHRTYSQTCVLIGWFFFLADQMEREKHAQSTRWQSTAGKEVRGGDATRLDVPCTLLRRAAAISTVRFWASYEYLDVLTATAAAKRWIFVLRDF